MLCGKIASANFSKFDAKGVRGENVAKSLSERNREFAKKMKARNRPIEEIVEDTGLTEEEVKAL